MAFKKTSIIFLLLTLGVVVLAFFYNKRNVSAPGPVIELSTGKVQGLISISRDGREFHDFRGLPYAEAPVGDLRFEV